MGTICPWWFNWLGTACPGGPINWGPIVGGPNLQGPYAFGTKCVTAKFYKTTNAGKPVVSNLIIFTLGWAKPDLRGLGGESWCQLHSRKPSLCQNDPHSGGSFWHSEGLIRCTMTLLQGPQRSGCAQPNLYTLANQFQEGIGKWQIDQSVIL